MKSSLRVLMAAALVAAVGIMAAGSARADDDDRRGRGHAWGHDREWHEHEWRARRWHRDHPVYVPYEIYAPPPVVYYPPPPSGFNLIFPLHIN